MRFFRTHLIAVVLVCFSACVGGAEGARSTPSTTSGGTPGAVNAPNVNPDDLQSAPGCWSVSTKYPGALPQGKQKLSSQFAGPVPTTKWWSSAAWDFPNVGDPSSGKPFSMPLYAQPISAMSGEHGLWVSYTATDTLTADGTSYYYQLSSTPDLLVGASALTATGSTVQSASDWSVSLLWTAAQNSLRTTLVKGSPYVYVDGLDSQALVQLSGANPTVFSQPTDTVGVSVGGHAYGLFAPPGCTWQMDSTGLQFASTLCGKGYYSVAALPDTTPSTLAYFRAHAFAFVTNTQVAWNYDEPTGKLTTTYTETVDAKEPSLSAEPLMALFPHQWKHSTAATGSYTYASPRGTLKVFEGHTFQTELAFHGVLPALPGVAALDANTLAGYFKDLPLTPNSISMADTYTSGVAMNQVAQWIPIAEQTSNPNIRDAALGLVKTSLTDWFSATGDAAPLFEYHPTWSTLVGYPAGFGSDTQLNDHHFHWGYHIAAAALVSLYDPLWGQDTGYGGMVKALVRDAANPLRTDGQFPFLRHFDVYEGHSWASGHSNFVSGNDQESSSEAMNFAYALIYWGEVQQNKTVRDLGVFLYATEADAIEQYWFNADASNFPADSTQADYTILWGAGSAYATWWTSQPEALHGIEFLPFTGGSLYLGANPNALQTNYNALVKQLGGAEGTQPNANAWVDIIWNMQAMYDPNTALGKFTAAASTYTPEAGESRAHTYQWLSNLVKLGTVDTTVTADSPMASAFSGAAGRTYVSYNTYCDHPRTVTFSDGTAQTVPAHTLMASQNGNVIAQTVIGSTSCVSPALNCNVVDPGF